MYIIENGKVYLINGEVGYLVNFNANGKMNIDKENTIDVLGKVTYTYDEIYRKLNIAQKIQQAKNKKLVEDGASEIVKELKTKIDALTRENEELKKQLNSKTIEPEKANEVVEEVVEVQENKKKNK